MGGKLGWYLWDRDMVRTFWVGGGHGIWFKIEYQHRLGV